MTSPYSSSLLNQPVEEAPRAPRPPAPRAEVQERLVTHVVAPQVQPYYAAPMAPQQSVYAQAPRESAVGGLLLGLIVILVGAVALVGSYYAARESAPSADEAVISRSIALREAYRAGTGRGVDAGRAQALENASTTTALRTSAAREQAYAAAFRRGERAGRSSYRPTSWRGYGGGYRAPRYGGSGFRNADVYAAVGQAQNIANLTGAPVDVEIY